MTQKIKYNQKYRAYLFRKAVVYKLTNRVILLIYDMTMSGEKIYF